MERYEPSGRFGAALLPALFLCAAVGAGLAWLYQWLMNLIPFIYVNLLLTLGFGFVLLTLLLTALRAGRNRSRPLSLAAAVVVPFIAVIASFWWGYRLALPDLHEQLVKEGERLQVDVLSREEFDSKFTFDDWLDLKVESGWTVGRATSSSNGPALSGFFVYAIWLIEAGILVGFCVMGVLNQAREPYCERCGVWQTAEPLGPWSQVDGERLRRAVSEERIDPVLTPVPVSGSEEHAAFVLSDCPECENNPIVDVAVARLVQGKDGKVETKTDMLAQGVVLTCAQRDALRAYAYPAPKEPVTA